MKVEVRGVETLWQNTKFMIEESELRIELFDGQMSRWMKRVNFERGDSAAVIIFNRDSGKIGLIKQFRNSVYRRNPEDAWIIELVAGTIETDESPKENITKELLEETGYSTHRRLFPLFTFYVSPGSTTERVHLFYMEVENTGRTETGGGEAGSNENIEYLEFSREELANMLAAGELKDAKTIIAVQWLLLKWHSKKE